jgi:hypothetical protein
LAGTYPGPRIRDCKIKADLLRKITEVHNQLAELYQREVKAMKEGDRAANEILASEIMAAQKRRTVLLIEFQDHVDRHGC